MWKWNSIFSRKLNITEKADKHISGRKYDRTKEAAVEAIRTCRDRDALKDYLNEREKEVVDIMMANPWKPRRPSPSCPTSSAMLY